MCHITFCAITLQYFYDSVTKLCMYNDNNNNKKKNSNNKSNININNY